MATVSRRWYFISIPFTRSLRALHAGFAVIVPAFTALALGIIGWLVTWNKRTALNWMGRFLGHFGLLLAAVRIKVNHQERLGCYRPAIFIFNHRSGLDPIIICRLIQTNVIGIAKIELKHNPVLGPLLRFGDTLFVDRHSTQHNGNDLSGAFAAIENGLSIAVAPEGSRSKTQEIGEFKTGAFRIAIATGRPIVPIYIRDAHQCLPPRSSQLKPGVVHIDILPAIMPQNYELLSPKELAEYARQLYLKQIKQGSIDE